MIKSDGEIGLVRQSTKIAGAALSDIMSMRLDSERHVEVELEYRMTRNGASGLAYVPVIAGGPRACIIHYTRNDQMLRTGELLLVDAGGIFGNYCSDITRTWPLNGQFTEPQLRLYESVWRVQQLVLNTLQQQHCHGLSLLDLNSFAYHACVQELARLGFRRPEVAAQQLFPHSIGHHLGMDLHDCPSIPYDSKLAPGMIITIEPGLYVPDSPEYPEEYRGIGIRIEDDVLVRVDGAEVLTEFVPKLPNAIAR